MPQNNYPAGMDQLASTVCDSGAKEGASANKKEALHINDWQRDCGSQDLHVSPIYDNGLDSLGVYYLYFNKPVCYLIRSYLVCFSPSILFLSHSRSS